MLAEVKQGVRIISAVSAIDGHGSIRVDAKCNASGLSVQQAARLGLLVTEFLMNALDYAFESRDEILSVI